jgi:1,4-alpha-glucan branching enzyme
VTQAHSVDPTYGDYWTGQIDLNTAPAPPGTSAFGQPGRYVYRYVIHSPARGDIDFIIDPFSREVGVGRLSAITVGVRRTHFPPMKRYGKRRLSRMPSFMS